MMMIDEWSKPDIDLACDACLKGTDGTCQDEAFHSIFPSYILAQNLHMHALELLY